jgi:hypothetical protein
MVGSQNRPWTEEDDRLLLEMRLAGKSTLSICAALKRSGGAIKARLGILRSRAKAQASAKSAVPDDA